MKLLAMEKENAGVTADEMQPLHKAEALRVWELYQAGAIREMYFRQDIHTAVLVLECEDMQEAKALLETLPLVEAGMITFEVIPLIPYSGFERLFSREEGKS